MQTVMEQWQMADFEVEFYLDVLPKLYAKVHSLGVEGINITGESIGDEPDIRCIRVGNSIGILGDDESEVNEELTSLYQQVAEDMERRLEYRTKELIDINNGGYREHHIVTWLSRSGWMYCFAGVTVCDIFFEGEDIGPFASREAALEDAQAEAAAETA